MDKKNSSIDNKLIVGRIKQLLNDNNLLERDLVEFLGIGGETFNNWKKNRSDSYLHYLLEISEFFHVTTDYLLSGKNRNEAEDGEMVYSEQEMSLIDMFRKVKLNERKYVIDLLKSMTSST